MLCETVDNYGQQNNTQMILTTFLSLVSTKTIGNSIISYLKPVGLCSWQVASKSITSRYLKCGEPSDGLTRAFINF